MLLAFVIRSLNTHPSRDGALFLLLRETPPTFGRSLYFFHVLPGTYFFLLTSSPSGFAFCGHHLPPSMVGVRWVQQTLLVTIMLLRRRLKSREYTAPRLTVKQMRNARCDLNMGGVTYPAIRVKTYMHHDMCGKWSRREPNNAETPVLTHHVHHIPAICFPFGSPPHPSLDTPCTSYSRYLFSFWLPPAGRKRDHVRHGWCLLPWYSALMSRQFCEFVISRLHTRLDPPRSLFSCWRKRRSFGPRARASCAPLLHITPFPHQGLRPVRDPSKPSAGLLSVLPLATLQMPNSLRSSSRRPSI